MKQSFIYLGITALLFTGCTSRHLTSDEVALAYSFYGKSLNYDVIKIQKTSLTKLGNTDAFTINNTIRWQPETYSTNIATSIYYEDQGLFIHELCHVWQYQNKIPNNHGGNYSWREALQEQLHFGTNVYNYPVINGNERFTKDFRFEQQAAMIQYYLVLTKIDPDLMEPRYRKVIYGDYGIQKQVTIPTKYRNIVMNHDKNKAKQSK